MLTDDILISYSKSTSYVSSVDNYIQFTLSAGTYSITDFNAKIKGAVLQSRHDWKLPQINSFTTEAVFI